MTPSRIISGIPPTRLATTGRPSAIASRITRPCASRYDGSTATSSAAVTAGTSSRRPVKTTLASGRACRVPTQASPYAGVAEQPERLGLRLERLAARALAHDQQPRVRDRVENQRPRLEERRVALLRLEPRDHADQRRSPARTRTPRAACSTPPAVVAIEVHAVVDHAGSARRSGPRRGSWPTMRAADRDQTVHLGRQHREQRRGLPTVADATRMDRVDQERPRQASLDEAHHRPSSDDLRPIHVAVDDLRRPAPSAARVSASTARSSSVSSITSTGTPGRAICAPTSRPTG